VLPLQQRARESAKQVAETLTNTLWDRLTAVCWLIDAGIQVRRVAVLNGSA
jgi:hypothetical protein